MRWPAERARREQLQRSGRPRLLLLEDDAPPPEAVDCMEDWARLPVSELDLGARVAAIQIRCTHHDTSEPVLDDDGVLRHHETWVALPPVEARLMAILLERGGTVVSRDSLARSGWPEGAPGRNALDVHMLRLRRRLEPLGMVIRTVRSRGYLLETGSRQMATMG